MRKINLQAAQLHVCYDLGKCNFHTSTNLRAVPKLTKESGDTLSISRAITAALYTI